MLFGQLPGQMPPGISTMTTAMPSYAAMVTQFLNRFGPYRLQPYRLPQLSSPAIYRPAAPNAAEPFVPRRPAIPRHELRAAAERGGNGRSRGSQGRSGGSAASRSGNTSGGGGFSGSVST